LGVHAWCSCHACPKCKSKSSNIIPPMHHQQHLTLFWQHSLSCSWAFSVLHSFCRMTNVSKAQALSILTFLILKPLFQNFIWHKLLGANHFAVISRI
jgi:hypothetical protein